MPLIKVWSENMLNKKFVVTENLATVANCLLQNMYV